MKNNSYPFRILLWSAGMVMATAMVGCTDHDPVATAQVRLINTGGAEIGTAELTEDNKGVVTIEVNVSGLTPGKHGIHFHAIGVAEPTATPPFSTSGDHYNPTGHKHGLENPEGTHAGDLPNLEVDAQGKGHLRTTTNRIRISDGTGTLFDTDGTSLIIHEKLDDQVTDPSGNSGGRVAGGVVIRK